MVESLPELMVVMPVYNEQASVRKVVNEWVQEIENWTESFVFLAINDGSSDASFAILHRLREQLGPRFEIRDQSNAGHGQSCLRGYREACRRRIPHVLQIDSDGQCDPQYFFRLWRLRNSCDVVYGVRKSRDDGFRRVLASIVLRLFLMVGACVNCRDANVPYRLMRTERLEPVLDRIPQDFVLSNIGLAVLLARDHSWKHCYVPIGFRERYGGEPSVPVGKFADKAAELRRQLHSLRG